MYPPYKEGDDVTSLINGVKEGDDVTNLINGAVTKKEPSLKSKLLKGSIWDTEDTRPFKEKAKSALSDLAFGREKTPNGRTIIGRPVEDSLLPANITGKHEPESYYSGVANSLYKDFIRPLASDSGALGMISPGKVSATASHAAELAAADKGLPINPKAIPMPENYGKSQGAANARLGLPPAPIDAVPEVRGANTRFIAGDKGIAEANKTYPMDTAPVNPRLGDTSAGTILPRETEGITQLPGSEAARLGTRLGDISKIETSSPKANLVSLDKVRQGAAVQLPKVKEELGNIGDSSLPYQLESAPKQPKIKPQALDATGGVPGNTIPPEQPSSNAVVKNSSNATPSSGLPPPGQAQAEIPAVLSHSNSKDINPFRQEAGSVDKTLASRPETAPIAQHIIGAQDAKTKWIAETQRKLATLVQGLTKSDRVEFGEMLNRPLTAQDNPALAARVTQAKSILDEAHALAKLKGDPNLGYIDNYLTHIEKNPDDSFSGARQIWESYFKKPFKDVFTTAKLTGKGEGLGDMYEKGLGDPNSPFARTRTGSLKDIELDVNKVFPAYTESIAKLIFDKPAVDQAKKIIAGLADTDVYGQPSRLKELAQWYVKNYTHYDAAPGMSNIWNQWTSSIMKTTARSMLGFSTGLQTLHLARIPMNLYPELGEKYMGIGAAKVMSHPIQAYQEAASLGLLQNEVKPFAFKTKDEVANSVISFFQAADFLDKSIGYHGFKQKFIDAGMNEADAQMKAIAASKKASLTIDAARPTKVFNPEPGLAGMAVKLSLQFKQVPVKIIEQYLQIAANAKNDPKTAARAIAGLGLTAAAAEAGFHTLHISPKQFAIDTGGAFFNKMKDIGREAYKGNVVKALEDTALFFTPGGISLKRQITNGPSMFEHTNKDIPMPR